MKWVIPPIKHTPISWGRQNVPPYWFNTFGNVGTTSTSTHFKRSTKVQESTQNRWRLATVPIHNDNSRVNWKLALVTSINRGRDGLVCSINLRTTSGTTNRPITKLHPLEVQAKEVQCHTDKETTTVQTLTPVRRPQGDAAQRVIRRIADWAKDICVAPEDVQ